MEVKVRRLQVLVGCLLLGGALGSQGDDLTTFAAAVVGGLGLSQVLGAFLPDDA